jgi:hypothetical protein
LEFSAVWHGEFVPKQLNSRCVDYQHEADQDRYEQTTHIKKDGNGNPMPNTKIDLAGLSGITDSAGHFELVIPGERLRSRPLYRCSKRRARGSKFNKSALGEYG